MYFLFTHYLILILIILYIILFYFIIFHYYFIFIFIFYFIYFYFLFLFSLLYLTIFFLFSTFSLLSLPQPPQHTFSLSSHTFPIPDTSPHLIFFCLFLFLNFFIIIIIFFSHLTIPIFSPSATLTSSHCWPVIAWLTIRSSIILKMSKFSSSFFYIFLFLFYYYYYYYFCTKINLDLNLLMIDYLFGLIGLGLRHYFLSSWVLLIWAC